MNELCENKMSRNRHFILIEVCLKKIKIFSTFFNLKRYISEGGFMREKEIIKKLKVGNEQEVENIIRTNYSFVYSLIDLIKYFHQFLNNIVSY